MRLSKCFEELKLFQDHMMGFRPNTRTSNNVFILNTLIDKQFHKGQKLYCCFVDFPKAFDTIWRRVKRIYGILHWTTPSSTFGLLLDHFWSTHLSLVLMIVASFYPWSTFGLLLDHFWSTHPNLVLMTVASFLLLRAQVTSCAPTTRSSMLNLASLCIVLYNC